MIIIAYILWCVYAYFEGRREGYYYHDASITGSSSKYNIHWIYFLQRGIVLALIEYNLARDIPVSLIGVCHVLVLFAPFILSFSFIHDGAYYCQRNDLDATLYPKRWEDSSTDSTAFLEFSYKERLKDFILGFAIMIAMFIYEQ